MRITQKIGKKKQIRSLLMQEKYTAKRLTKNTCMIRRYWEKFGKIEDIGYILYRFEVIIFYVYFISLLDELR